MAVRKRKTEKADLRNRYRIYIEIGMLLSLLILIAAFSINWQPETEPLPPQQEQEVVQMEEIQQTQQIEQPPPPPKPPVPVEVPNDEILEDEELNLDATLDLDDPVSTEPPPPPPPEEEEQEPETFVIVEDMPEMLPSQQEGMRQLQGCVKYPEMAKRAGVEGRVFVQFVVDEKGNVIQPTITRGIGAGTDEEALRCVRDLKFKPGQQRGKPVRVKMSLPVTFKLR